MSTGTSKIIDLSGPLYEGMWDYNTLPGLAGRIPPFRLSQVTTIGSAGAEILHYEMSSLSGTYLETGAHMIEGEPMLSDLDASAFVKPAVVCHLPRKQARELIHGAELAANCPPLQPGDALLIECGWGSQWRSPSFINDGPSFHADCLPWLSSQPMSLLGVDVPCMQAWWAAPGSPESGSGMLLDLFKKHILLLAPLVNLDSVTSLRGELIALPLNASGASGSPCRALWRESSDMPSITGAAAQSAAGKEPKPEVARYANEFFARWPELGPVRADFLRAYHALISSLAGGGTIFLCGNGGSWSDALHISGELLKSFEQPRPLPPALAQRLAALPGGDVLAANLQAGLRAIVLGANVTLSSAVQNDFAADRLGYAQELLALARPGDLLLGLSTSGNSVNVLPAVLTAKALGLPTILLTGESGGRIAPHVDIAVRVPAHGARSVQELHLPIYHALCAMIELHFFPS